MLSATPRSVIPCLGGEVDASGRSIEPTISASLRFERNRTDTRAAGANVSSPEAKRGDTGTPPLACSGRDRRFLRWRAIDVGDESRTAVRRRRILVLVHDF
jgi:hypothetical protein